MNIDIYKFSDLFTIKVKILGIKYLVFRKRKSGSDNAPILNMTRKTEKKNEAFRANHRKSNN